MNRSAGSRHPAVSKQKLELLELEMRARAIKKMLESQQQTGEAAEGEEGNVWGRHRSITSLEKV